MKRNEARSRPCVKKTKQKQNLKQPRPPHCTSIPRTTEQSLDLELLEMWVGAWDRKVGGMRLARDTEWDPHLNKSKSQPNSGTCTDQKALTFLRTRANL